MKKHTENNHLHTEVGMELLRLGWNAPYLYEGHAEPGPKRVVKLRCYLCKRIAVAFKSAAEWFEARSALPA